MARIKDPNKIPSIRMSKLVWYKWIQNNPERLDEVPVNKLPEPVGIAALFEKYPDVIDPKRYRVAPSSIQAVMLKRRDLLPKLIVHIELPTIRKLVSAGYLTPDDIPTDIKWHTPGPREYFYNDDYKNMLLNFGTTYMINWPDQCLRCISESSLVELLRIRPDLVMYADVLGFKPMLVDRIINLIRMTTPSIDTYLTLMV